MGDIAVRVENLCKRYEIGAAKRRHDTLRDQIADGLKTLFRNNGRPRQRTESIWALKDVSFEIKHGEVVGVIGRNGAGKSTLLKILSRITEPTTGYADIHGRVGSLLEVGTGFHGELTGRENIYLNGAILGMKKAETARKFDEIVAFSGIEKFMETPVKRYSTGMYIRLAFAVAAHLEPEILLVDEVLAVGDMAFQKKCLGKMENVAKEGRTVVFISHNMAAMENLCQKVVVLEKGEIAFAGATRQGIDYYFQNVTGEQIHCNPAVVDLTTHAGRPPIYRPLLTRVELFNGDKKPLDGGVKVGGSLKVAVRFQSPQRVPNMDACLGFDTLSGQRIFTAHTAFEPNRSNVEPAGEQTFICEIPHLILVPGVYKILVALGVGGNAVDVVEDAARIEVVETDYYGTGKTPWNGLIVLQHHWYLQ
jgi:lipopolysaccharide transport system ATP-binding protein